MESHAVDVLLGFFAGGWCEFFAWCGGFAGRGAGWELVGSWLGLGTKGLIYKCDVGCLLVGSWLDGGEDAGVEEGAEEGSEALAGDSESGVDFGGGDGDGCAGGFRDEVPQEAGCVGVLPQAGRDGCGVEAYHFSVFFGGAGLSGGRALSAAEAAGPGQKRFAAGLG